MIVYHGGTEEIKHPVCKFGRPHLDFGQGFYLTDILEQAKSWAGRQAMDRDCKPVVNVYEFDYEEVKKNYRCLYFGEYDEAWLDFIVNSRRGYTPWASYDVVEVGIANDRVIDTVELYSIGLLSKDDALGRLSEHRPNNQICILNQDIVEKYLKFGGVMK